MIESIGEHFNFNGHKWEDMTKIVIGHIISSFEGHKEETWGKKIIDSRSKSFKYDGNNKKTIKKQNYQKKKSLKTLLSVPVLWNVDGLNIYTHLYYFVWIFLYVEYYYFYLLMYDKINLWTI